MLPSHAGNNPVSDGQRTHAQTLCARDMLSGAGGGRGRLAGERRLAIWPSLSPAHLVVDSSCLADAFQLDPHAAVHRFRQLVLTVGAAAQVPLHALPFWRTMRVASTLQAVAHQRSRAYSHAPLGHSGPVAQVQAVTCLVRKMTTQGCHAVCVSHACYRGMLPGQGIDSSVTCTRCACSHITAPAPSRAPLLCA